MLIAELSLEEAAKNAVGNWKKFDSFCWDRDDLDDAENWSIHYTNHRDSGLLAQSNASVIGKTLRPFTEENDPDIVFESHSHWVVGWVAGFSVRVFRNGEITNAFTAYHELAEQIAEYLILDEEHYSRLETEATFANLKDAVWRLKHEYELPKGWEYEVYDWLDENNAGAIDNTDDQGGCPTSDQLRQAFEGLGYKHRAESDHK